MRPSAPVEPSKAFYLRRAAEEREKAVAAPIPEVAAVHEGMAKEYERLFETGKSVRPLVIVRDA